MDEFTEIFTAVLVLIIVISAWREFFIAILKLIWLFRVPLVISLILWLSPRIYNFIVGV